MRLVPARSGNPAQRSTVGGRLRLRDLEVIDGGGLGQGGIVDGTACASHGGVDHQEHGSGRNVTGELAGRSSIDLPSQ